MFAMFAMFGIGVTELLVIAFVLLVAGACVVGLIAALILMLRSANTPKNCPHCGKPLR